MFWAHAISRQDGSEADGIHLLWAPPRWAGYSHHGFDIWRRPHRAPAPYDCYELTRGDLIALESGHRAETPPAVIHLSAGACPGPLPAIADEPYQQPAPRRPAEGISTNERFRALANDERARIALGALAAERRNSVAPRFARVLSDPPFGVDPGPPGTPPTGTCLVYEFRFRVSVNAVRLTMITSFAFAVAFREEKVVDSAAVPGVSDITEIEFRREAIDRVIVWMGALARGIVICWTTRDAQDDAAWNRATLVARGVQMPLQELDAGLGSVADEHKLVESRLLAGEDLGPGDFKRLSETMNAALRHVGTSPVHMSRMVRGASNDPFIEIAPWEAGLSLTVAAAWRRALGFGFLDPAKDLEQGASYDYRIIGGFRRRDLEEHLLGFHTVPLGTPLPRSFWLGGIHLDVSGSAEIVAHPAIPARGLGHSFRKGLRLDGRVTLAFAQAQSRIVLELEPDVGPTFTFRASTTDLIPGLPITVDSGNVPIGRRVQLTFAHPVTRVRLRGKGVLYGVRFPALGPDDDPDQIVQVSAFVPDVRFAKTQPPDPPSLLGTSNLQQPPPAGDPEVISKQPPHFLGFRLQWLPPSTSETWPPGWWASEVPAVPPTDVVGFEIDRRRIDRASGWVPFGRDGENRLTTLVAAGRTSPREPAAVRPGDDLLAHFPEVAVPTPPVPVLAQIDDVINSTAGADGVPPGSQFQYRIRSVDAIGRRSAMPTTGSVVRLEKRVPPPQPVGPPVPADETRPIPRGVRARLLQANDPLLTPEDNARLAGRANAVLLEWAWTDEERRADPWAREFRLYWQPNPPDLIEGEITGPAAWTGAVYEVPTTVSHAVTADRFAGEYMNAGGYPFRIAGHAAGNAPRFRLDPSQLSATPAPVPAAGRFQLGPSLNGEELRPPAWAERTHVVPIDAARVTYEYVFPHVVPIDADHPRARVWAGVSAADDQAYRPDAIAVGRPNGGRPGNESSIVPAVAEGRWLGRPEFEVPPPLPDVATELIPEVAGDEVTHEINVPALLPGLPHPAGIQFRLERLSAADLTSLLVATEADDVELLLPAPNVANGVSTVGSVAHPYAIANAADRAALVAAIRTGEPARIENRFLMDLAIRFAGTTLENFWQPASPQAIDYGRMPARVPNKAERFLYRLRWVDAAGRTSANVAFVPRIFRVPSLRAPAIPRVIALTPREDSVRLVVEAGERFDVTGILVFVHSEAISAPPDRGRLAKPQLLRTPNRPDLYPAHGLRLRLSDGTLLAPAFAPINAAAAAAGARVRTWTIDHVVGYEQSVAVWVAAVTRDGVGSKVTGAATTVTPVALPVVPALVVTAGAIDDAATWPAGPADVTWRIERSLDGGATWQPVSPWLPAGTTAHAVPTKPGGRDYRLRARRGIREATGNPVAPV